MAVRKLSPPVIALAGNPNVGKSTLFNALTGMHQHTGNWPGKTVAGAQGIHRFRREEYRIVDLPGTYSLLAHSAEEEVARDALCFDRPDGVVVVCDATCLERNLNLVLQTMEIGCPTLICVNLMDEAARKGIQLDLSLLEKRLGVPVIATVARKKGSLAPLSESIAALAQAPHRPRPAPVTYPAPIEGAIARLQPRIQQAFGSTPSSRWLTLRLLEGDPTLLATLSQRRGLPEEVATAVAQERNRLAEEGYPVHRLQDALVSAITHTAGQLCRGAVVHAPRRHQWDRAIDRVVTGRLLAYPLMLALLAGILWLTIVGANTPSDWLSRLFDWGQQQLTALCAQLRAPAWLHGALVLGAYRVLAWVVAVMLPPMAIFFPLFTLLEDIGYLPRIAYNLDRPFQACHACGKQALTLCMGFGCNAVGVTGCRIIDSPRERMLAVLTNSLVPCNGRFPALITLITLFFVGSSGGIGTSWYAALLLTGILVLGVLATLLVTRLLAITLLRGTPSSFTLELPPYRPPQVGRILIRSVLDRTLFVLGRAAAVAAPAGLVIWILANVSVGNTSLLTHLAGFLDPAGRLMGLDGMILLAFILGLPANEIVLPLILMGYLAQGTLPNTDSLPQIREVLVQHGWTWHTALCTVLFSLFHWPCSTTLLTIRKETGGWRWVALAVGIPTALGAGICILLTACLRLLA